MPLLTASPSDPLAAPQAGPAHGISRREALRILAAQMTLTAAGCSKPDEEILPYVRQPERIVAGEPLRFATTLSLCGFGRGVVCVSVDGRPIKI